MQDLEVTRNGDTDQFSIVLTQGNDTVRCMVTVAAGRGQDLASDEDMKRSALSKAKALARALDASISDK